MVIADIIALLEARAPLTLAEPWDNVGLQVGSSDLETESCLLTVDVTRNSVREAKAAGASLIIAHHPLIFKPLAAVTGYTVAGQTVLAAARATVSVYVAHTNLDSSLSIGTAAALADQLGIARGAALVGGQTGGEESVAVTLTGPPPRIESALGAAGLSEAGWCEWQAKTNCAEGKVATRRELVLSRREASICVAAAQSAGLGVSVGTVPAAEQPQGLGMVTAVPQMRLDALATYVGRKLSAPSLSMVGDPARSVERVALVPGSGGEMVPQAAALADVMVTGEIKYHDALLASDLGLAVLAAGHYQTERPVLNLLARYLREATRGRLHPAISQESSDPFANVETPPH